MLRRRKARTDLAEWCRHALAPFGQAPAPHHLLLIRELEAVARGDVDRLMVLMPPGSAKSTYVSTLFPAWWFAQHPQSAVIAASHTAELAERFGRRVRNMIDEHGNVLGYGVASDNRAAGRWETTKGGEYFAAGVGGAVTGRRADLALIDDPVKSRADAESETVRESTWAWYRSDLYTRLKPGARIVLVMTRWHQDDIGGRVLTEMQQGGDTWRVLSLPALATLLDDPLGRKPGEPLWPDWEDAAALARKRAAIGEREFGSLYQQDPQPAGASFFREEDFLVDGAPVAMPHTCDTVFAVIDTAVKTGSANDGTAVTFCAYDRFQPIPLRLIDWDIAQIEGASLEAWLPTVFRQLEHYARQCGARMGSSGAWIEDRASGMVLLQQVQRHDWPAQAIESKLTSLGKEERAINASPYVVQGLVKLTDQAYNKVTTYKGINRNHLLSQLMSFRIGAKDGAADDLLDTVTYSIAIALGNSDGF